MKAIVLTAYGDVDRLEWREMPEPRAAADSLVVRMAGASINPVDWKIRSGHVRELFPVTFPAILGRDASGEVVQVGKSVTDFAIGDRVLGLVNGGYAELVSAPANNWAKLPDRLDLAEAGALPLVLLTGAQLIEEAVNPGPEVTLLITGALGGVGRAAVHAAQRRGAKVWAGVRRAQREEARELGVDGVVALDDEADIAKLPRLDAIADTVGGETLEKLYARLKPGGIIGSVLGEPPTAKERGFTVRAFMAHPDGATLSKYATDVARGRLAIPIAAKLPLERAGEAHTLAETQHPGGKVLLLAPLAA